jgi:CRISPR/Cas system-associated exonuclease Cas4 (RecB family)
MVATKVSVEEALAGHAGVLVVNEPGLFVGKHSERVIVRRKQEVLVETPLLALEQVIILGNGISFIKSADGPLARNHCYQLALQALLLAEQTSLPVRRAFVYWIARREAEEVPLSPHLVRDVSRRLAAIRAALGQGMPEPTDQRGHCLDCESRRFCGDVV